MTIRSGYIGSRVRERSASVGQLIDLARSLCRNNSQDVDDFFEGYEQGLADLITRAAGLHPEDRSEILAAISMSQAQFDHLVRGQ
jgi:hypothetical protein